MCKWWEKLKKAGKKLGKAAGDPDLFEKVMKKIESMDPTIQKMRYFMYCIYLCFVCTSHNSNTFM